MRLMLRSLLCSFIFFYLTFSLQAQNISTMIIGLEGIHDATTAQVLVNENNFGTVLKNVLDEMSGGGKVQLLDGVYVLSSRDKGIQLRTNQSIHGVGSQTTISVKGNGPVIKLEASTDHIKNVSISNVLIAIQTPDFNSPIIKFETKKDKDLVIQNNKIENIKITYETDVKRTCIIEIISNEKGMIRDNQFKNIEAEVAANISKMDFISIISKGRLRDNDFYDINIKRRGPFNGNLISGVGIKLTTRNTNASILNNSFQNIKMPPSETGIFLGIGDNTNSYNVKKSWINNNRFIDIYFEGYGVGIEFFKMPNIKEYNLARNVFRDLILQTKKESTYGIKNIFGKANAFIYCNIYDWKKKNIQSAKQFIEISSEARFTMINNPQMDIIDIIDNGDKTAIYTNGSTYQDLDVSNIMRTGQIQIGDPSNDNNGHEVKLISKSKPLGTEFKILTKDKDNQYSKKLSFEPNGNVIISKKLKIKSLPIFNSGNIIIENDQTIGKIDLNELKRELGITSLEKELQGYENSENKKIEELINVIEKLEEKIKALEDQSNHL